MGKLERRVCTVTQTGTRCLACTGGRYCTDTREILLEYCRARCDMRYCLRTADQRVWSRVVACWGRRGFQVRGPRFRLARSNTWALFAQSVRSARKKGLARFHDIARLQVLKTKKILPAPSSPFAKKGRKVRGFYHEICVKPAATPTAQPST